MFVDECSTNIALTGLYARAPKGERAYGKAPRNWGKNVTLICSMGAGAEILFLPPYSPDFSPIEEAFSKVKAILRRIGARTREALLEATSEALSAVSSTDARGWFGHCGYHVTHRSL